MAVALPYIGLAIAGYGAYKQSEGGWQAAEDARENAAATLAESQESARRLKQQQDQILSETKARASASGIQSGGTVDVYLSEMRKNFQLEQDWITKSGASAANIETRKGRYAQQMASSSAWGTIGQGLSTLY